MRRYITTLLAVLSFGFIQAQDETNEKDWGIQLSGFVKHDAYFDTRQTVAPREGHFLLWPSAVNNDDNGNDINAKASFNMLAVQSRLGAKITGPDAFGAKTSGMIEGDFFAQLDDNINLFRMRHAFVKLNWTNTELLTGQTWNPLFVTSCFPGTVSFNTGTPLQSFARNPQIRITHTSGDLKLIGAALSQRDYTSRGPAGISSSYLRNSALPDLHAQIHYSIKKDNAKIVAGAGVAYKSIVPQLSTTGTGGTYKTSESVGGLTAIAFSKIVLKPVTIKLQYRYGENNVDVLAPSGFAIKEVVNAATGKQTYTPLKNQTIWAEAHTNGKDFQVGLFAGYLMNLGTKDKMSNAGNTVYGLGTNIQSLLRVSPRVIWNSNKFRVALELEYTQAAYGDAGTQNTNYIFSSTTTANNLRTLVSTYYFF